MDSKHPILDQRRFSRISFDADVRLSNENGQWESKVLDISLKGLLIKTPKSWEATIGDHFLTELFAGNEDNIIRMEVSVSHSEDGRVGFNCEHIDLDSVSHLRRLIELNIGDPEILNRELSELGGGES